MKEKLKEEFVSRYGTEPEYIFFCPGRVNLIGEHVDYNGGNVMPCAISSGTYLAVSKNTDHKFRFQCLNFSAKGELDIQSSYSKNGKHWFNYPLGVIDHFIRNNFSLTGLDMLFFGNIPIGAGLSSSASIEVVTAYALTQIFKFDIQLKDIALLSQKVENNFIGVNCGIMDQFAVAMGKKEKAILLNCDTLEYEYIPFQTDEYLLAIINTNKQRTLADSKYNERFAECRAALTILQTESEIKNLCEIDSVALNSKKHLFKEENLLKRAAHVISENERVYLAIKSLKENDLVSFGKLMFDSHQSLKDLYEVSGKELDTIVDFCKTYKNCIGARMTGAGFGGCAIALVNKNDFSDFSEEINSFYKKQIGYLPGVFASAAEDGVRSIIS